MQTCDKKNCDKWAVKWVIRLTGDVHVHLCKDCWDNYDYYISHLPVFAEFRYQKHLVTKVIKDDKVKYLEVFAELIRLKDILTQHARAWLND